MNWIAKAQGLLERPIVLGCDAGHAEHNKLICPISEGEMLVFDRELYKDVVGFCPGNDDVSRTLWLYGVWEPIETRFFDEALERDPGLVIDFGSQIGWYSMLATAAGHDVLAIEALWEHEYMTATNAGHSDGTLHQVRHWVDETTPTLPAEGCPPISIVKIDIEGAEQHALRCIKELLDAGLVANLLVEISPVFNDSYPAIVLDLLNRGYQAIALNPIQPMTLDNYIHILDEIPQVDVMFSR